MQEQVPVTNAASLAFALQVLAEHTQADAFTPITVKLAESPTRDTDEGVVAFPDEDVYYAVASLAYDRERDEYVLTIDQSRPAPGKCGYTLSHTRSWCGNPRCRER